MGILRASKLALMQQKNVQAERNTHMRQIPPLVIVTGTDDQFLHQFVMSPIGMTTGKTGAVGLRGKRRSCQSTTVMRDQANTSIPAHAGPSGTVFVFTIFPQKVRLGSAALAHDGGNVRLPGYCLHIIAFHAFFIRYLVDRQVRSL